MRWKIDTSKIEWEIEFDKGSKYKDRFGYHYEIISTKPWRVALIDGKEKIELKNAGIEKFFQKLFKDWKEGLGSFSGFKFYYKNKEEG